MKKQFDLWNLRLDAKQFFPEAFAGQRDPNSREDS